MKTILITAQKGGVAKSTLTFLLAQKLSQDNKKVGVVDFDNQGSFLVNKDTVENFNNFKIFSWKDITTNVDAIDDYDYLLIDTPPYNISKLSELVELADTVIIPTKFEELSLSSVNLTFERILKLDAKEKSIIVPTILNHTTGYKEAYEYIDSLDFQRVEHGLMNYIDLSRLFLSNVVLEGNCQKNTDICISEIINFINR